GREATREVVGATCDEVVSAIALIAAVAIDPNASAAPSLPAHPPATPAIEPPTLPPPLPPAVRIERPPPPAEPRARWRFAFGAELGGALGPAPSFLVGIRPYVELGRLGAEVLLPSFRVSFFRRGGEDSETHAGTASFVWTAFRPEVCPLRWPAR